MWGVINAANRRLLSRHRLRRKAETAAGKQDVETRIIKLRAIPTHRGMIGHTWPRVGTLLRPPANQVEAIKR